MSLISIRAKRATQRREGRSLIEIGRIIMRNPQTWVAHVTYTYGRSSWEETVTFTREPITRKLVVVTVRDGDYPHDRVKECRIARDVAMPDFITSFLISGRW